MHGPTSADMLPWLGTVLILPAGLKARAWHEALHH